MANNSGSAAAPRHDAEISPPAGGQRRQDEFMPELKALLNEGIGVLLNEALQRGTVDPPYGHPPLPDPEKILQDVDGNDEGDDDDGDVNANDDVLENDDLAPAYKYEYGFNPLVFLGTWLKTHNPRFIAARELERKKAAEALVQQGRHAKHRDVTFAQLQLEVFYRRSGVLFAPVVGCVSQTSCVIWAKGLTAGTLVFEVSLSNSFTNSQVVSLPVTSETAHSALALLEDLKGGSTYHYRVHLRRTTPNGQPLSAEDADAQMYGRTGRFTTVAEDGSITLALFTAYTAPPHTSSATSLASGGGYNDMIDAVAGSLVVASPTVCLLLGDPSLPPTTTTTTTTTTTSATAPSKSGGTHSRSARYSAFHRRVQHSSTMLKLLSSTACITAWSDPITGGGDRLRAEQAAVSVAKDATNADVIKKYREGADVLQLYWPLYDYRTSSMKEGGLPAAAGGRNSSAIAGSSSSSSSSSSGGGGGGGGRSGGIDRYKAVKSMHHCVRLNAHADLFVLDSRDGVIGTEQAEWLKHSLLTMTRPPPPPPSTTTPTSSLASLPSSSHPSVWRLIAIANTPSSASSSSSSDEARKDGEGGEGGGNQKEIIGGQSEGRVTYSTDDGVGGGGGGGMDEVGDVDGMETVERLMDWIYAHGCPNVVFLTTAPTAAAGGGGSSSVSAAGGGGSGNDAPPYVVRYFERNKEEGRFPIHEFACRGLVVPCTTDDSSSAAAVEAVGGSPEGEGVRPTEKEDDSGVPAVDSSSGGGSEQHVKVMKVLMSAKGMQSVAVSTTVNVSDKGALLFVVREVREGEETMEENGERREVVVVSGKKETEGSATHALRLKLY